MTSIRVTPVNQPSRRAGTTVFCHIVPGASHCTCTILKPLWIHMAECCLTSNWAIYSRAGGGGDDSSWSVPLFTSTLHHEAWSGDYWGCHRCAGSASKHRHAKSARCRPSSCRDMAVFVIFKVTTLGARHGRKARQGNHGGCPFVFLGPENTKFATLGLLASKPVTYFHVSKREQNKQCVPDRPRRGGYLTREVNV